MILKRTRSVLPTLSSNETEASLVRDDFLVIFYLPLPPAMLARSPINSEHPPFIQDHHFPIAQSLPWNHESDLSKCYRPHPRQCYFSTCYSCICLILAKLKPFLIIFVIIHQKSKDHGLSFLMEKKDNILKTSHELICVICPHAPLCRLLYDADSIVKLVVGPSA